MNYFKINAERLFSHGLTLLTVSLYVALLAVLFAVYEDAEQNVKLNNASAANANFLYLLNGRREPTTKKKKKKTLSYALIGFFGSLYQFAFPNLPS